MGIQRGQQYPPQIPPPINPFSSLVNMAITSILPIHLQNFSSLSFFFLFWWGFQTFERFLCVWDVDSFRWFLPFGVLLFSIWQKEPIRYNKALQLPTIRGRREYTTVSPPALRTSLSPTLFLSLVGEEKHYPFYKVQCNSQCLNPHLIFILKKYFISVELIFHNQYLNSFYIIIYIYIFYKIS